jgi:hypothetical protein
MRDFNVNVLKDNHFFKLLYFMDKFKFKSQFNKRTT